MSNIDILITELTTDPLTRGYSGMTDEQAADDLNTSYRTRNRTQMSGDEVASHIDETEWVALTDSNKQIIVGLLGIDSLDPFGFASIEFKRAFGAGSTTVSDLATARVEAISRATELGLGTVKPGQVEEARR